MLGGFLGGWNKLSVPFVPPSSKSEKEPASLRCTWSTSLVSVAIQAQPTLGNPNSLRDALHEKPLCLEQIPSLLRLKHFPSVTFAGMDSPEDILDHTYQELFHSGGFVVTDDTVLETMTLAELKEMVKTLEKLNGHGRWKWLLHYKETKKLREDARGDPAARAKESLLQSCQGANITKVLHYHPCDSRSCPRDERLHCLLILQVQHISERFAVFLTGKASASREALESKGILVLDVNTFIATAPDMVTPSRSGY